MLLETDWEYRLSPVSGITSVDDRQYRSPMLLFAVPGDLIQGQVSELELDRWADDGGAPARDEE